jgi:hypothetical protein
MTNSEMRSALKALRNLFEDGRRWHKGCNALTEAGAAVNARDPRAWSFCLWGGCQKVAADHSVRLLVHLRDVLRIKFGDASGLTLFNDRPATSWSDVKAVLDAAIEEAGAADAAP